MFDLENESQGHRVQQLQWPHSIGNINFYKSHTSALLLALTISRYSHCKFRNLENIGQSHDIQHLQWCHEMANTDFLSDGNTNVCICPADTYQNSQIKSLPLKIYIKAACIIVIRSTFALALTICKIFIF